MSNNNGITDLWLALDNVTIQHVAVDLETKHVPKEHFTGALIGVGPILGLTDLANPDSIFIWVATGEKFERLEILNSADYEISLIHIGAIQNKEPLQISSGSSASGNLERCLLVVETIAKTQQNLLDGDSGLIDAARFTDWTAVIRERISKDRSGKGGNKILDKTTEKKTETNFSRSGGLTAGSEDNQYACGYHGYNAYVAKKVTTKSFKRSTKYPIGAALDAMKKKLDKIRLKAYTPLNPFSPIVEDKDQKVETTKGVSVGDHVRIIAGQWINWEGRLVSINKERKVTIQMPKGTKIDLDESWVIAISAPTNEATGMGDMDSREQWPIDGCYG